MAPASEGRSFAQNEPSLPSHGSACPASQGAHLSSFVPDALHDCQPEPPSGHRQNTVTPALHSFGFGGVNASLVFSAV